MEFIKKNPKIIVLSGKAKSGKDLVADKIELYYKDKKCIQISYAYYLKQYIKKITNTDFDDSNKPRTLLQEFGINLIKKIDPLFLVNRVIEDIKVYSYFYDVIIITDARLKEEITELKKVFEITTIRINTSYSDPKMNEIEKKHITETDLDNYDFDYVLSNFDDVNKILEEI